MDEGRGVVQEMEEYIKISETTIRLGQGNCKRLEAALLISLCKLGKVQDKLRDLEALVKRQQDALLEKRI